MRQVENKILMRKTYIKENISKNKFESLINENTDSSFGWMRKWMYDIENYYILFINKEGVQRTWKKLYRKDNSRWRLK